MRSITRVSRPALATALGAALALAPSAAIAAPGSAVGAPLTLTSSSAQAETAPPWAFAQRSLQITSPQDGATVDGGYVRISVAGAPRQDFMLHFTGPGMEGDATVYTTDDDGRWESTLRTVGSGLHTMSVFTLYGPVQQTVSFTVR